MKKHLFLLSIAGLVVFITSCNSSKEDKQTAQASPAMNEAAETAAIMKVIEGETDCFFKGDYEGWARHWSHESYAMQAWNHDNGTADAAIGWDKINKQGKDWIETYYKNGENIIHPEVRREKPLVRFFSPNAAYLTWTQYNADKEKTTFRTSQEIRIMEKNEDGWKIVNVAAFWDTKQKIPFDSLQLK